MVGALVNPPVALGYKKSPTAFTCVQMRAQALYSIPYGVYINGDIEKPVSETHPAMTLLDEVNPEMNWIDLVRATESDMLIYGMALWHKMGNPERPDYIDRINPGEVQIDTKTGELRFRYQPTGKMFSREEVVFFHDYNPVAEYAPLSPLTAASRAVDIEIFSAEYMAVFFSNSAVPPVIFTTEQAVGEPEMQRVKRWWRRDYQGRKNAHKVGFMDRGLKPEILGYPTKDLAMKEVRAEARRDICAALRVPPALAGAWEAANYATATEQKESFYNETVIPRAEYIASALNAELLVGYQDRSKFVWRYDELQVMQDDRNLEANRIATLVRDGVITPAAGARELGYEDADAGIGPIQTRIVDDTQDMNQDGKMDTALGKWEKKACNSLQKGRGAQVGFESDYIPDAVSDVIFDKLDDADSKDDVRSVFAAFRGV